MTQTKRLIYKIKDLKKSYGSFIALNVNKLEIHPGTIYGIIGTVGSGKSVLLNIMAGVEKESGGMMLYDDEPFDIN